MPCSAKLFEKQLLITELCESVWPTSPKSLTHGNIISCFFGECNILLEINWSLMFSVTVNDPIGFVTSDMRTRVLEGKMLSYLLFL